MKKIFKNRAFTLMELLIVVVATGIIAAFAIPNYQKAIEAGYARSAIINLLAIKGAQEIYKAKNGAYFPTAGIRLTAAINTGLSLNLSTDGLKYSCWRPTPDQFLCLASRRSTPVWVFRVTSPETVPQIQCNSGPCPSIDYSNYL